MLGLEVVYLLVGLVAMALVVGLIRRAATRNRLESGPQARARLAPSRARAEEEDDEDEDEDEQDEEEQQRAADEDEDEDEEREQEAEAEQAELPPAAAVDDETRQALREGLAKTRGGFVARLGKLFSKKRIDQDVLGELEEVLFSADIGPKAAEKLFSVIKSQLTRAELEDPDAIWSQLRKQSATILNVEAEPVDFSRANPFVLLVLGVNGVGKTTTIGKLAAKLTRQGKKVLLAAGDTFRAAAVEQLERWGERAGVPVVKGKDKGDPSSVIFDAVKRAQDEGFDVVIADTAGRLHTKVDLMEELKKVGRVIDKAMPGAPHETWLVLDSTTGQNAIAQAQVFKSAMHITGIVLTKLDGTAKGGVILGICDELGVPVRFIGIGEKIDDMREFDPQAFVDALYEDAGTADAA